MSRDVLVRGNVVIFLDRLPSDQTAIPNNASLISESDWKSLVGESEGKTFDELEKEFISSMGWITQGQT